MNKYVMPVMFFGLMTAMVGCSDVDSANGNDYSKDEIDLNLVLDITVETLHSVSERTIEGSDTELAFLELAETLAIDYNKSVPALYTSSIGVSPQEDSSLLAFDDTNNNKALDENEILLFKIEVDGEKARIIASSRSGAVNDHHFSGTSLIAGYLIGSMLTRQRGAGVSSKSLASKQPVTSRAAAKARAGSGSHSKGK